MSEIKAVIIDDDAYIHWELSQLIEQQCPDVHIVATAETATEGKRVIERHKPELVFLDIRMPDATGFDLLQSFEQPDFKVVFVTSYNEFAITALRFSALDYLLKPVSAVDLCSAIERFKQHRRPEFLRSQIDTLKKNLLREEGDLRLHIASRSGDVSLPIRSIIMCEGDSNYTHIHRTNGKRITATKTLKDFEELLSPHQFIRIHKKYLANAAHIKEMLSDGSLALSNGHEVEVSKRRLTEVKEVLRKMHDE
jgi:two-component system LytT family response regulator